MYACTTGFASALHYEQLRARKLFKSLDNLVSLGDDEELRRGAFHFLAYTRMKGVSWSGPVMRISSLRPSLFSHFSAIAFASSFFRLISTSQRNAPTRGWPHAMAIYALILSKLSLTLYCTQPNDPAMAAWRLPWNPASVCRGASSCGKTVSGRPSPFR